MNRDNKHSVNLFNLFAQFNASVFSSFWYRLSDTVSVLYILKGGSIMTDQELLDMLIDTFHKNKPDKSIQEEERILKAYIFIENLPSKEKELVENYIDSLISQLASEKAFLYRHGFIDRIKVLKYISKL